VTLWVGRDGNVVTIHGNIHLDLKLQDSRVTEYSVTEDAGHLRGFWAALGRELDEAEKPAEDAPVD
jgi:hypothetical protein